MVLTATAIACGIAEVRSNAERLCGKAVKKSVAKAIKDQLPKGEHYLDGVDTHIIVDSATMMAQRQQDLFAALDRSDWEAVLVF